MVTVEGREHALGVVDPAGRCLTSREAGLAPEASRFAVSEMATIDPRALLELSDLLAEPEERSPPLRR